VAVLILIVQTNCLLFTYLGQWMMKVFEQSLVTMESVLKAKVIFDKESGRFHGFGFVTYSNVDKVNDVVMCNVVTYGVASV
jgi:uncharacterized membrane protein YobD (UPF0266 family)